MTNEQVTEMRFARLYPLLEAKAVKKGRTREEVQQVVTWLTGYSAGELKELLETDTTYGAFFANAPRLHPERELIKGVVCGVRVEEIADPLMREIRRLDQANRRAGKGKAHGKNPAAGGAHPGGPDGRRAERGVCGQTV